VTEGRSSVSRSFATLSLRDFGMTEQASAAEMAVRSMRGKIPLLAVPPTAHAQHRVLSGGDRFRGYRRENAASRRASPQDWTRWFPQCLADAPIDLKRRLPGRFLSFLSGRRNSHPLARNLGIRAIAVELGRSAPRPSAESCAVNSSTRKQCVGLSGHNGSSGMLTSARRPKVARLAGTATCVSM